jgi:5'-methylthioadenosine phosphorylase
MNSNELIEKNFVAIIGGSGFYELLEEPKGRIIKTPFGDSSIITEGYINNQKIVFLPRHSKPGENRISHSIPPHKINYRANVYSLYKMGIKRIIATHSCGSLNDSIVPGTFVLPNQFIDLTKIRESTFFDGTNKLPLDLKKGKNVIHTDMTEPFCSDLVNTVVKVCKSEKINLVKNGVYICTEGPRFETHAEINFFKKIGGDLVGMTLVPEVILSRELGLCYLSISLISNFAAGLKKDKISFDEVIGQFEKNKIKLKNIIIKSISLIPSKKTCKC